MDVPELFSSLSSAFCVSNASPLTGVNSLKNQEAYHEDLTKERTKAQVKSQLWPFLSKSGGLNVEHPEEALLKDSRAGGGMK